MCLDLKSENWSDTVTRVMVNVLPSLNCRKSVAQVFVISEQPRLCLKDVDLENDLGVGAQKTCDT